MNISNNFVNLNIYSITNYILNYLAYDSKYNKYTICQKLV